MKNIECNENIPVPKDVKGKIGWLKIITAVFNNNNSLLITALSAISSAVLCATAYLYRCVVFWSWNIPRDIIQGSQNDSAIYYIVFGILFLMSTLISQIILRYMSFNTIIELEFWRILKRVNRTVDKHQHKIYKRRFARIKRTILKESRHSLTRMLVKNILVALIGTIPFYVSFQLIASETISFSVGICIIAVSNLVGGIIQARTLTPQHIRTLSTRAKNMDGVNKCVELLNDTENAMRTWKEEAISHDKLGKIWGTISRVDLYTAIFSIILSGLLLIAQGATSPISRKKFWILEGEQQTYAAVYFDGNGAIFKKVFINGDTIQIKLNEQMYSSYSDKQMIHREFQDVQLQN